jgi:hypothetical protein
MSSRNLHPKVGSVSITSVNFNSWTSTPVVALTAKSKKTKVKEIVNEIFVECGKVTEDPFWVEKFNLAAVGKFPTNFYYHDNTLTYKKGAKNNKIILSSNIRDAALSFIKFLRVNKSIFSPLDEQSTLNLEFNRINSSLNTEILTWEIATKKIKECLISHFVIDMTTMMNLVSDQSNQLRQVIQTGIFSNLFDKHNITLKNDRIFSIGGLLYDPQNKKFYIDPNLVPSTNRSYPKKKMINNMPKDTIPQFNVKWDKYINKYVEQIDKQYFLQSISTIDTDDDVDENDED